MSDNTFVILAFFVATVLIFSVSPTGNYVSNYNPASNPSKYAGGCTVEGKMDCVYEASTGWWTAVCRNGRWFKSEFCGTPRQGDRSCIYKRVDYGNTITTCRSQNLPEENENYGTQFGSIVYTP